MKQKHWKVSVFDKTSETIRDDTFYTTDTEAYLVFELTDEDFTPDSATVTVYNIYGKATINASAEVVDGVVSYEIPEKAIGHPGGWRTQVIYTKDNEDYTTKIIEFDVGGHLLDNKKPAIVDIENWNSFIAHAGELIDDWEQLEEIRQTNEQQREANESLRESSETEREGAEQNRVTAENERNDLYDLVQQKLENGEFIGEKGDTGDGLEYVWNGTQLGVRREGETTYQYVNLKGDTGEQGLKGETGDTGEQGPPGKDLEYNWDGSQLGVKQEGETTYQYVNLKGDKGDKGVPGEMENLDSTHIVDALGYVPISATDVPEPTWENLQNKPTEFNPTSHTHSINDVTGLRAELDSVPEPTKENVGLGNVDNVKQASKVEFDEHNNDATRHVTSVERTKWNEVDNKVDKVSGKGLSTNDYTTAEKNKLAGIESGANKYTHPGSGTNPHGTTKSDIGLGNVDDVKQASKAEFDQLATDFSAHQADYTHQLGDVELQTNDKTLKGAINELYDSKLNRPKIYGFEIDETNSNPKTAVTYIEDATGMTPASGNDGNFNWGSWEPFIKEISKPVVMKAGVEQYDLNYDDYTKKASGGNSTLTGADGDVFTKLQHLHMRYEKITNGHRWLLASKPFEGSFSMTEELENGYNQFNNPILVTLQNLYLLIFKDRDSQTALGRGRVGGAGYIASGNTNDKGYMFGSTQDLQMKFLGIEDFWGNKLQWVDGLMTDSSRNLLLGTKNFNDTGAGYEKQDTTVSANLVSYFTKVQGGKGGYTMVDSRGSQTTHYADYGTLTSGRLARFGGAQDSGGGAGAFSVQVNTSTSSSYVALSARLCYKNADAVYIGAYLGFEQSGELRSISGNMPSDTKTIGQFRTLAKANN